MKMAMFSTAVFIMNRKMLHSQYHQKLTLSDVNQEVLPDGVKFMSYGSEIHSVYYYNAKTCIRSQTPDSIEIHEKQSVRHLKSNACKIHLSSTIIIIIILVATALFLFAFMLW